MIRIAICDDNMEMLIKLDAAINSSFSKYTDDFTVKRLSSGILLMNEQKLEPFDVIFLDIDMPKISGFDVAKMLRNDCFNCFLIFVTNYSELIYEGMDFQPFHFIRKKCNIPVEESVSRVVKILMRHMKQNKRVILEDTDSKRYITYIRDIVYIESNKHYMTYHLLSGQTVRTRGSLKECEKDYDVYDFVRIHKSYYVNLRYVSDINIGESNVMLDKINLPLPLGKNFRQNADKKYMLYMRKTL